MTELRIAQIANFISETSGGIRVALDQIGQRYQSSGHQRLLILPGAKDSVVTDDYGTIATVKSPKVSGTYRVIFNLAKVKRILARFNPTSIEVSDKWTLTPISAWAKRRGIGSVLFSHERLEDMAADYLKTDLIRPVIGWRNKRLAKAYDAVVVTSQYSKQEWRDTSANLHLVALGVDLATFNPSAGQPALLDANRKIQISYAGRLSREKYPQLAVETALELNRRKVNFELTIYGTGAEEANLRKLAGQAPVVFAGFVNGRAEVAKCYAKSDLVLSPCPTETFGLAPLEALACGAPVVTADTGGAHETVSAECGEAGSPDEVGLADATCRLIDRIKHDRGGQIRKQARARAEQYPWDATVEKLLAIHRSVSAGA